MDPGCKAKLWRLFFSGLSGILFRLSDSVDTWWEIQVGWCSGLVMKGGQFMVFDHFFISQVGKPYGIHDHFLFFVG